MFHMKKNYIWHPIKMQAIRLYINKKILFTDKNIDYG